MAFVPALLSRRASLSLAAAGALVLGFGLTPAEAHGPTRQKVVEKITIAAPADKVWAAIQDFAALSSWHPAVAESSADKGNGEGSVRTLKLKGGGEIIETLEGYNAAERRYSYRAKDGGALPVTNYTSTISVSGEGNESTVEWRGAFYRGHPGNNPPAELNDDAAVAAITGVYKSGLEALKKKVEGK